MNRKFKALMENSKIEELIITANISRLKYISLISLGFSVFALLTDFLVHGVWRDESLFFYKVLDIALTIISVSAVSFFWLFKIKNSTLQKTAIILFPFLILIWSAVITGIDFNMTGFSTLIVIVLVATFFLYLNLIVSILYFVGSALALLTTIYFMGNINENYLSLIFLLIPIVGISVLISARNYKNKLNDLFNQEKLVEMNDKLHDSNENLEREVQKRTKEIHIALEKAEESDRLKSSFLSNLSHEIRTPMNSIMGFASLLPEEESKEMIAYYSNIIVQNSEHLLHIIDDIVIYSRLKTGLFSFTPNLFNVECLLAEVQQSFSLPEYKKDIELKIETVHKVSVLINSDYEKLKQIFNNLISNAYKYTCKGLITFGYTKQKEQLTFFVRDTGIGIPINELEKVFERFYRASNVNIGVIGGTGLGLSIVNELVDLLGGKIWVESEEGKGSTFYFTLPYPGLF